MADIGTGPWSFATDIGGDIITTGVDLATRKRRQKRAFGYAVKAWEMQNAYNHPAAQMQRYREAGLNPNLMFGQGTSGNAEQIKEQMPPEAGFQIPSTLGKLGQYMQIKNMEEQARNISSQTALNNARAVSENINAGIKELELELKSIESAWKTAREDGEFVDKTKYHAAMDRKEEIQEEIKKLARARGSLVDQQVTQAEKFYEYMDANQWANIFGKFSPFITTLLKAMFSKTK